MSPHNNHRVKPYLSRLQFRARSAVHIDRILARILERLQFVIEDETVGAQFMLVNAVRALDVRITLIGHRIATVALRALARERLSDRRTFAARPETAGTAVAVERVLGEYCRWRNIHE